MSEEQAYYGEDTGQVHSDPRQFIRDLDKYYAIIPESLVWAKDPIAIALYCALDRICNGDQGGYVSNNTLAERLGVSIQTVRNKKRWLIQEGYIIETSRGTGRNASEFVIPFQTSRGKTTDTPGVNQTIPQGYYETIPQTETIKTKTIKQRRDAPEIFPDENISAPTGGQPTNWPEWYSLLYGVDGVKVSFETAEAWREAQGISVELATTKVYGLRDWWDRQPPARRKNGDPYKTWQYWCRDAKSKEKPKPSGESDRSKFAAMKAEFNQPQGGKDGTD